MSQRSMAEDLWGTGEWQAVVDGVAVEAAFFESEKGDTLFVRLPEEVDVLIRVSDRQVRALERPAATARGVSGSGKGGAHAALPVSVSLESASDRVLHETSFEVIGDEILFSLGTQQVRIVPAPDVVGALELSELLARRPEYGRVADALLPGPELSRLWREVHDATAEAPRLSIQLFFGSWCSVCARVLPRFVALMGGLREHGSGAPVTYIGVAAPPEAFEDEMALQAGVRIVPTAIVLLEGREIGRFSGPDGLREPAKSLELVLKHYLTTLEP